MSRRHTKPLTDPQLKGWVRSGKQTAKSDGDGLTFTVSETGYASWILRYGFNGARRELSLGRYPELSLLDARRRAREERARIDQGKDVAAEKRRAKHASLVASTVAQVANDYDKTTLAHMAATTRKIHGGYIAKWLVPELGSMVAKDVRSADIVAMLKKVSKRGAGAVKALLAATRNVFEHAVGQAILEDNPAIGIRRKSIVKVPDAREGIALDDAQLGKFLRVLGDDIVGWTFRLHLMTGVRPTELLDASWKEFDVGTAVWSIPKERTKTRRGYEVAIAVQGAILLQKIRKASKKKSAFLFPAAYGKVDRPIPYQTYRGRLRRLLELLGPDFPQIKAHDLRRTMRSGLTRLGIRYEVSERAINHKLPAMAEIYDRNEFRVERRQALAVWANHMDQLEKEATGS